MRKFLVLTLLFLSLCVNAQFDLEVIENGSTHLLNCHWPTVPNVEVYRVQSSLDMRNWNDIASTRILPAEHYYTLEYQPTAIFTYYRLQIIDVNYNSMVSNIVPGIRYDQKINWTNTMIFDNNGRSYRELPTSPGSYYIWADDQIIKIEK